MDKSTYLVFLLSLIYSCVSIILPVTSIETKLKKTYRNIGFSRKEASFFCGFLDRKCSDLFTFADFKNHGITVDDLCIVTKLGALIDISQDCLHIIQGEARAFADNINNRRLTKKSVLSIRSEIKKFVFSCVINYLKQFENCSIYLSYVMKHETDPKQTVDCEFNTILLDELSDEFGLLGMAQSVMPKLRAAI